MCDFPSMKRFLRVGLGETPTFACVSMAEARPRGDGGAPVARQSSVVLRDSRIAEATEGLRGQAARQGRQGTNPPLRGNAAKVADVDRLLSPRPVCRGELKIQCAKPASGVRSRSSLRCVVKPGLAVLRQRGSAALAHPSTMEVRTGTRSPL